MRACPNILQLDKVYEGQEHVYLAMHYEKGGTVSSRIRSKGPFNEATLIQFAEILLQTIALMHEKQIVHRDLKPDNILLASENSDTDIRICDFGLAVKM